MAPALDATELASSLIPILRDGEQVVQGVPGILAGDGEGVEGRGGRAYVHRGPQHVAGLQVLLGEALQVLAGHTEAGVEVGYRLAYLLGGVGDGGQDGLGVGLQPLEGRTGRTCSDPDGVVHVVERLTQVVGCFPYGHHGRGYRGGNRNLAEDA